ncbi:MAG: hypothetical protein ACK4TA_20325 [Saprospiraceae bacterium]
MLKKVSQEESTQPEIVTRRKTELKQSIEFSFIRLFRFSLQGYSSEQTVQIIGAFTNLIKVCLWFMLATAIIFKLIGVNFSGVIEFIESLFNFSP